MKRLFLMLFLCICFVASNLQTFATEVKDATYYTKKGADYEWKNNRLGAIDAYTQALKVDPDCIEAHIERGKLYYFTGQYEKALADFNYFYNLPAYGPAVNYEYRIECKKKLGQYAEAMDDMYEVMLAYGGHSLLAQNLEEMAKEHPDLQYKLKPISHPQLIVKYKANAKKLRDYAYMCANNKLGEKNKIYADFFMDIASTMDPTVTPYTSVIYDTAKQSELYRKAPSEGSNSVMDVEILKK